MKDNTVSAKAMLGDAAAPQTAAEFEAHARTQAKRAYRDNVTGAVYEDATRCVNGCTTLSGADAEKALATGEAPPPAFGHPPTPEEQTEAEIARRHRVEAEQERAAADAAAKKKTDEAATSAAPAVAASAAPKGADEPAATKARKKSSNK